MGQGRSAPNAASVRRVSRRGWLLLLVLGVIWGMPYLFIRIAVETFEPMTLVLLRVVLAGAVLLPIAAARRQLGAVRGRMGWVALFALMEMGIAWTFINLAEKSLTSSLTALVLATIPTIGVIAARVTGVEHRLSAGRIAGLAIGFFGVVLLVGLDVSGGSLVAIGFLLISAFCYATAPLIVARKLSDVPSLPIIAVSMLVNAIVFVVPGIAQWPDRGIPASAWVSVVVLGLLCSAVAFIIFFALIAEVGPARTTLITYINPVVAVILGIVVLSEPFTIGIAIGFPLILIGSWLASRKGPAIESEPVPA